MITLSKFSMVSQADEIMSYWFAFARFSLFSIVLPSSVCCYRPHFCATLMLTCFKMKLYSEKCNVTDLVTKLSFMGPKRKESKKSTCFNFVVTYKDLLNASVF